MGIIGEAVHRVGCEVSRDEGEEGSQFPEPRCTEEMKSRKSHKRNGHGVAHDEFEVQGGYHATEIAEAGGFVVALCGEVVVPIHFDVVFLLPLLVPLLLLVGSYAFE